MLDADGLARALGERLGLEFDASAWDDRDGQHVSVHPHGVERTQGFCVEIVVSWRRVKATFYLNTYAAPLAAAMERAGAGHRVIMGGFVDSLRRTPASVGLRINGMEVDPSSPTSWPKEWRQFSIDAETSPMAINDMSEGQLRHLVHAVSARITGAGVALLPMETVGEADFVEGGAHTEENTRFERNRLARSACIERLGASCNICGFDFERAYGEFGCGYIEVHHIDPISSHPEEYVINPVLDLIPVCSNCHSMLHRRRPPYTPDEIRDFLRGAGKSLPEDRFNDAR